MRNVVVLLAAIYALVPRVSLSEESPSGILFQTGLSWQQVLAKATAEHKPIFVDGYATWCEPCKEMDRNVYTSDKVGAFFNAHFISIKVQMDKTPHDSDAVKAWYADAGRLATVYTFDGYPTFLFFAADGTPLHKAGGSRDVDGFIALGNDALNPAKQYFTLVRQFEAGKIEPSRLEDLARTMRGEDKTMAGKIAAKYLGALPTTRLAEPDNVKFMVEFHDSAPVGDIASRYIQSVPQSALLNPENSDLMWEFRSRPEFREVGKRYLAQLSSTERYSKPGIRLMTGVMWGVSDPEFKLFRQDGDRIDKVMGQKGYARRIVDYWIGQAEIAPRLRVAEGKTPDFAAMHASISRTFSTPEADRLVVGAKVQWYDALKDKDPKAWPQYTKYYIENVEQYGRPESTNPVDQNNFVYQALVQHDATPAEVAIGAKWMEKLIKADTNGGAHDTYANLIYKYGDKSKAIRLEEQAVALAHRDRNQEMVELLQGVLEKMRRGERSPAA